eukprot:m.9320 g.9320  ORF g.9320 m.9320 type:complete len:498 (+) comp21271_c0_seq1:36-1529(+)
MSSAILETLKSWLSSRSVRFGIAIVVAVSGTTFIAYKLLRKKTEPVNEEVDYRALKDAAFHQPAGTVDGTPAAVAGYFQSRRTPNQNSESSTVRVGQTASNENSTSEEMFDQGCDAFSSAISLWEKSLASCQVPSSSPSHSHSSITEPDSKALAQQLRSTLRQAYFVQDVIQHTSSLHRTFPDGDATAASLDAGRVVDNNDFAASSSDSFVSASVDFTVERGEVDNISLPDGSERGQDSSLLYQEGLKLARAKKVPCRSLRSTILNCQSDEDFLAKLYGVRKAFDTLFMSNDVKQYVAESGKTIMTAILKWAKADTREFQKKYDSLIAWVSDEKNWPTVERELAGRGVPCYTFYDIVLDFVLIDAFEDAEKPPSAIVTVLGNRWLTQGFKKTAFTTCVWSIIKAKKKLVKVSGGFLFHFYEVMEHISPIMAWGLLGPDKQFRAKIQTVKEQVLHCLCDIFSEEKSNYSSSVTLSQDILSQLKFHIQTTLSKLSLPAS